MYKIFIRRGLSFAVGYPSPWLSFAVGILQPQPKQDQREGLQRGGQSSLKNGVAKYAVKSNYQ